MPKPGLVYFELAVINSNKGTVAQECVVEWRSWCKVPDRKVFDRRRMVRQLQATEASALASQLASECIPSNG